jgi:hypothetical protein
VKPWVKTTKTFLYSLIGAGFDGKTFFTLLIALRGDHANEIRSSHNTYLDSALAICHNDFALPCRGLGLGPGYFSQTPEHPNSAGKEERAL